MTLEDARRVARRLYGEGKLLFTIVGKPVGLAEKADKPAGG